jgi:LmbE family N-acetylglucosaminyl deacetylase
MSSSRPAAIAIAAHPDDIEYVMAGTLLLLKEAGWDIHYFNLSSGNCGSLEMHPEETAQVRRLEAVQAAQILGATYHESIANDMEIFYDVDKLRRVAGVIREVAPQIVLTHSPEDYMEDHMETCRLAVSAAFTHAMPNFRTMPERNPASLDGDITVYHAMPHGLRDGMRRRIFPEAYVDVSSVHATKLAALAAHHSQQHWLEASQGMNSYLLAMEDMSREVGSMSGAFSHAEGWRRHSHRGYARSDGDPLAEALGSRYLPDPAYEPFLNQR